MEVKKVKDILEEITRLRLQRNWTEYQLAERSNVPQSTISTWYRKRQIPTINTLEKICQGFGISLSEFFAKSDDPVYLTKQQRDLLSCWATLTSSQQALFMELFKNIP